jgi:pimeloyl-ACP methyl ester carboxylesterase
MKCTKLLLAALSGLTLLSAQELTRVDHYVRVKSTAPAVAGQMTEIYVREVVQANAALRGNSAGGKVALFIHGAGTPAEVAFDVPHGDFSWMGYLAKAGYDVFSMDMTGYGRSTRPLQMNDPCNLSAEQQKLYVPQLISKACDAPYPFQGTTLGSDWNDIDAVVDHIRKLRGVDKVNLLGWSQGGPRSGGYTAQHPEKVAKLIILAPAYGRNGAAAAPEKMPPSGTMFNTQSRSEFIANWDRQVGCPAQYDQPTLESVWSEMIASDPVGATWGTGVRRAPNVPSWGFNQAIVAKMQVPALLFAGVHDKQVNPDRVKELYADLGSKNKVFVELACSSHNAMWEKNHLLMFQASLEWLEKGTVNGKADGMLNLGN